MTDVMSDSTTQTASIIDKVRTLGPALRERALDAERAHRLSHETIAGLDAAGVFRIGSPAESNGRLMAGLSPLQFKSITTLDWFAPAPAKDAD